MANYVCVLDIPWELSTFRGYIVVWMFSLLFFSDGLYLNSVVSMVVAGESGDFDKSRGKGHV